MMIEHVIMNELADGQKLIASTASDATSLARKILAIDFARTVDGQGHIDRKPLMLALARLTKPTPEYGLEALALRIHAAQGRTLADCDERTAVWFELGRYSRVWRGSDEESEKWHRIKYGTGVLPTTSADKCWLAAAHRDLVDCASHAVDVAGQGAVTALLEPALWQTA